MTKPNRTVCPACESAAQVCEARRDVHGEQVIIAIQRGSDSRWAHSDRRGESEACAAAIRAACTHAKLDAERDALVAKLRESLAASVLHKSRREELLEDAAARAVDYIERSK